MIDRYNYTTLLAAVAILLIGDCSAFITPHTTRSKLTPLHQSTSSTSTDIDKESFQRSLLTAQLSNTNTKSSSTTTKDDSNTSNAHLLSSLNDPVPPAGHHVTTQQTKLGPVHTLTVHLGQPGNNEPLVFETGRIGRQAAGAILLTRGESIVYSTCGE